MVKKNKVLATKTISFLHSCLLHSSPAISMSQRLLQHSIGLKKCYLFRENSKSRVLFSLPFLEFFLLCLLFTYAHDYSFFFMTILFIHLSALLRCPSLNPLWWQPLNIEPHDKVLSLILSLFNVLDQTYCLCLGRSLLESELIDHWSYQLTEY